MSTARPTLLYFLLATAAVLTSCQSARAPRAAFGDPFGGTNYLGTGSWAQQKGGSAGGQGGDNEAALKQANNPLANMKAVNFQNYYIPEVSGTDGTANTFWVRYAQPISTSFGDWLFRASVPLSTVPTGTQMSESGLGDSNAFATYLFDTGDPAVSVGVGPILGLPTATDEALGTDQWSAGLAAVAFDGSSKLFQYGGLVTYQHKIAGSSRVADVNFLAVQPFGFMQLGGGLYLRSVGIWSFNLDNGNYAVPIGFGVGQVVKVGNTVFNFFIEPQFTVLQEGPGQPDFQIFVGFNTQFIETATAPQ